MKIRPVILLAIALLCCCRLTARAADAPPITPTDLDLMQSRAQMYQAEARYFEVLAHRISGDMTKAATDEAAKDRWWVEYDKAVAARDQWWAAYVGGLSKTQTAP